MQDPVEITLMQSLSTPAAGASRHAGVCEGLSTAAGRESMHRKVEDNHSACDTVCTISLGPHLYFPLMLRFRRVARREGYQRGNVRLPAASAAVFRVARVSRADKPRRCQSVDVSPLQNCICSAVGATGRMAACMARGSLCHIWLHVHSLATVQAVNTLNYSFVDSSMQCTL